MIGCAMAQVVSRLPVTTEARVRVPVTTCGICSARSGTWTGFCPSSSALPCKLHSTVSPSPEDENISVGGGSSETVSHHRHEQHEQSCGLCTSHKIKACKVC
jgi:hypothetical protein